MSYMISAWARMCKIMGSEFSQYLPMVMGPVLKAATIKPEVALLDSKRGFTLDGICKNIDVVVKVSVNSCAKNVIFHSVDFADDSSS